MPDDLIMPVLQSIQRDVADIKGRLAAQGDQLQLIASRLNNQSAMFAEIGTALEPLPAALRSLNDWLQALEER